MNTTNFISLRQKTHSSSSSRLSSFISLSKIFVRFLLFSFTFVLREKMAKDIKPNLLCHILKPKWRLLFKTHICRRRRPKIRILTNERASALWQRWWPPIWSCLAVPKHKFRFPRILSEYLYKPHFGAPNRIFCRQIDFNFESFFCHFFSFIERQIQVYWRREEKKK